MTVVTGTLVKCDAMSRGRTVTDWGEYAFPCAARRGLRSFTDAEGVTRYHCPAPGHRRDVERRFGVWPESCWLCGKPTDELSIPMALADGRLGLMCWRCADDAAPLSPRDELEERGTAVFEWGRHVVEVEVVD